MSYWPTPFLFFFFFRASANTSSSARCETEPEPEKVLPTLTPNNYFSDKAPIGFCSDGLLSQEHTARAASFVTAPPSKQNRLGNPPPTMRIKEPGELVYRHTYHSGQGCPAARTGVNAASTASRRIQARRRVAARRPARFNSLGRRRQHLRRPRAARRAAPSSRSSNGT